MFLLIASLALAEPAADRFPERTPALIQACLDRAVEAGMVRESEDSHKYMCGGEIAERFWTFLEVVKEHEFEQDTGAEGRWLSRSFPLGGCFKRTRMADGSPATDGLSCTIWIPKPPSGGNAPSTASPAPEA